MATPECSSAAAAVAAQWQGPGLADGWATAARVVRLGVLPALALLSTPLQALTLAALVRMHELEPRHRLSLGALLVAGLVACALTLLPIATELVAMFCTGGGSGSGSGAEGSAHQFAGVGVTGATSALTNTNLNHQRSQRLVYASVDSVLVCKAGAFLCALRDLLPVAVVAYAAFERFVVCAFLPEKLHASFTPSAVLKHLLALGAGVLLCTLLDPFAVTVATLGASAVACGPYGAPGLLVALYRAKVVLLTYVLPILLFCVALVLFIVKRFVVGRDDGAPGISIGGGAEISANSRPNGSSPGAIGGRRNQSLQSHESLASNESQPAGGHAGTHVMITLAVPVAPEIPAQNQLSPAPNVESPRSNTTGSTTSTNCSSGKKKHGGQKTHLCIQDSEADVCPEKVPTANTFRARRVSLELGITRSVLLAVAIALVERALRLTPTLLSMYADDRNASARLLEELVDAVAPPTLASLLCVSVLVGLRELRPLVFRPLRCCCCAFHRDESSREELPARSEPSLRRRKCTPIPTDYRYVATHLHLDEAL